MIRLYQISTLIAWISVAIASWTNYKQQRLTSELISSLRTANDSNDILLSEVVRLRQGCGIRNQPTSYEP